MAPVKPIAIVDDDKAVLSALSSLLRSFGYAVLTFASAEIFLAQADLLGLCCLITDMQMPGGMNGLELQAALAARAISLPVILMSGLLDETIKSRAYESGVIAFMPKPVDSDRLIAYLQPLCGD